MENNIRKISSMSFEEALQELESIVRKLEEGKGNLDDAIDSYSRGAELKKHCENKLKDAQVRIDKIVTDSDGAMALEPLKVDD
tara:strand:+ start:791 stop:1039 length:249 start_codon:yes stop_codon:yes gene_type:complete